MCNCVITSAFEFSSSLIDGCMEGKFNACLRGSLTATRRYSIMRLGGRANFRAKFYRKTLKTTAVSKNKQTKIETFIEICTGKDIKIGKRKTRDFSNKKFIQVRRVLLSYRFFLALTKKVLRF